MIGIVCNQSSWVHLNVKISHGWIDSSDPGYFDVKTAAITDLGDYLRKNGINFTIVYVDAPSISTLAMNANCHFGDYVVATAPFATYTVILNQLPCKLTQPPDNVYCDLPIDLSYKDHIHFDGASKGLLVEYIYDILNMGLH